MQASENFLEQYEAFTASRHHAQQMECEFQEAIPAMLGAVRTEMNMTPAEFGALLGVSAYTICGIEDGFLGSGDSLLWKLKQVLEEIHTQQSNNL